MVVFGIILIDSAREHWILKKDSPEATILQGLIFLRNSLTNNSQG